MECGRTGDPGPLAQVLVSRERPKNASGLVWDLSMVAPTVLKVKRGKSPSVAQVCRIVSDSGWSAQGLLS